MFPVGRTPPRSSKRQGQPKSPIGARRHELDLKGIFLNFESKLTLNLDCLELTQYGVDPRLVDRKQVLTLGGVRANEYRVFTVFGGVRENNYRMFTVLVEVRSILSKRFTQFTHFGNVFELIDGRFAICRPLQAYLVGRRHEEEETSVGRSHGNEANATAIGNLHGGMAERRAGSGGPFTGIKALFRSRDDAPLAAAPDSARRPLRRVWRWTNYMSSCSYGETQCAPPTPSRRICRRCQRSVVP